MRKIFYAISISSLILIGCGAESDKSEKDNKEQQNLDSISKIEEKTEEETAGEVIHLTTAQFKELVYDYEANPQTWVYRGTKPCIIDFYADWCKPCKMLSPILEKIAKEYKDDLIVYKINTENERDLAQVFQVQSIPMVLFVAIGKNPEVGVGLYSEQEYYRIARELINSNK